MIDGRVEGRYRAFTCVTFRGDGFELGKPTEYGVWLADFPVQGTINNLQLYYGDPSHNFCIYVICSYHASGFIDELGALLTFNPAPRGTTVILARIGVSFISSEQACANAEEEIPDFNFDEVHSNARAQWNDLLSRVQVDTADVPRETVELFYSSVRIILHTYGDQYLYMRSFTAPTYLPPTVGALEYCIVPDLTPYRYRRKSKMEFYRAILRLILL